MWHEARKQEKKIRTMVVDYRRRAERRREFYEKFKADPTQFMQVHGRPSKIYMDPQITVAADKCMMPWQGDPDDKNNLIDRFDVRTYLDVIPEHQHSDQDFQKEENASILNYERYRILIQNESSKTSEDKFLHQIHIEEQFGTVTGPGRHHHKEKEKPSAPKAAIGYNYEDSNPSGSSWSGRGGGMMNKDNNNTNAKGGGGGNANQDPEEEEESEEEVDFDLLVNMDDLNYAQKAELNISGTKYGLSAGDFMNYLNADLEEKEEIRLAKLQEEEKQTMSGRKARRERRAYKDRIILRKGYISPPSYAASVSASAALDLPPGEEEDDDVGSGGGGLLKRSSSESSIPEKIEFITSFGGNETEKESQPIQSHLPTNRNLPQRSARKWARSRSRSPNRRKMRSKSRSRSRDRSRKYVPSSRNKRDRKRSSSSSDSDSSRDRRRRRRRTTSSNSSDRRSRTRSRSRDRNRTSSSSRRRHKSTSKSRSRNGGARNRERSRSRDRRRDRSSNRRSRNRRRSKSRSSRSSSRSKSVSRSPIRRRRSRSSSSSSSPSPPRKSKSKEHLHIPTPSNHNNTAKVGVTVPVASSSLPADNKNGKPLSPVTGRSTTLSSVIEVPPQPPRLPSPPVRRYYGRVKDASSDNSDSDSDRSSLSESDKETNSRSSKRSEKSSASSGPKGKSSVSSSAKGSYSESGVKLTPQERLKKKMAAALNRQLKADKEVEKMRQVKQDQERLEREESLRELSIKYRRRERERRHRETVGGRNSDSDSSEMDQDPNSPDNNRSSHSRSPSPDPAPRKMLLGTRIRRSRSP